MAHVIEVQGLKRQFGDHEALVGVDFSVPQGSIYGFLGPNGAGKTTTIKILLGLIAASSGKVRVLGEDVGFGMRGSYLSRTGYLPQDPVFPEGLTGKEALQMVADIYRVDTRYAEARISELLQDFGLADAAKRKVTLYSRGMKQRLGIAAVLLTEPELLVLDEPVSALDPQGRRKVLELIADLRGKQTVFFSSHILGDVERVCDRIAIIDKGIKLIEDDTRAILDEYAMEQYVIDVSAEDIDRAQKVLTDHAVVQGVSREGDVLIATSVAGGVGMLAADVLPLLVQSGIVVREFMKKRVDLEEVFFRVLEQRTGSEVEPR